MEAAGCDDDHGVWTCVNLYLDHDDLSGCNLAGSQFFQVGAEGTDFRGANFSGATFTLLMAGLADFTGANLTDVAMRNQTELHLANFTNANVTGVIWGDTWCPNGVLAGSIPPTCCGQFVAEQEPSAGCP